MLDEGSVPVLVKCMLQLFIGVHHDRAIPGDRLADGFAGYEQKPDWFFRGCDRNVIAIGKQT